MTAADVLREARKLVEWGWTQHAMARTEHGTPCPDDHPQAVCWCVLGALSQGSGQDLEAYEGASDHLQAALGNTSGIAKWNDAPGRTQVEVLAAFSKAIELAEEQA